MLDAANRGLSFLDGPTLAFVMVVIAALLGLFLMLAWLEQRDVRARSPGGATRTAAEMSAFEARAGLNLIESLGIPESGLS